MKKIVKKNPQIISVPTAAKSLTKAKSTKKTKSSSIAYYNCLLTSAQQGWYDPTTGKKNKITACCKNCKLNAPQINEQRTQEVKKLILSYHQVGDSLKKLLRPIK